MKNITKQLIIPISPSIKRQAVLEYIVGEIQDVCSKTAKELNTDPCLPLTGISTAVQINHLFLSHLISELVTNAYDASLASESKLDEASNDESKEECEINIAISTSDESIQVCVKDKGQGFTEDFLHGINDPVFRQDLTSQKNVSTSLGGAGSGLKQLFKMQSSIAGSVIHFDNLPTPEHGARVAFSVPSSALLDQDKYKEQMEERRINKSRFAMYMYTGYFAPLSTNVEHKKSSSPTSRLQT